MEFIRTTAKDYSNMFPQPYIAFNSVSFSELNSEKVDELHYLFFKDTKIRLGIVLGQKGDLLCSPFSAPFGGFSYKKTLSVEIIDDAVDCLLHYAKIMNCRLMVSLPPYIYDALSLPKFVSSFYREGCSLHNLDLNYHFQLNKFREYDDIIASNARKNLNVARKSDFVFQKLSSEKQEDVERAYSVIEINRRQRGFPLRMSLQNVLDTIKLIKADFFVMSYGGIDVAAAQVFHVNDKVAQVIYWGDLPDYSYLRTMNFFTYKLFEYYSETSLQFLDIGPSTEESKPNYGLCEFKESIGCDVSSKFTFLL